MPSEKVFRAASLPAVSFCVERGMLSFLLFFPKFWASFFPPLLGLLDRELLEGDRRFFDEDSLQTRVCVKSPAVCDSRRRLVRDHLCPPP